MKNLDKNLARIAELKREIAKLDAERKELEASVIEHLESVQLVTVEWGEDRKNKATIVYGSSIKIDASGLQDELTAKQWQSVSVRVLDEKLLEDKVARGQIDVDLVAKHTTEVQKKPYVRLTEGK